VFDQVFALGDIPKIFVLSFIELLLSADNAVIIGALIHNLPRHLRKKALVIGVSFAFFIRAVAIASVSILFKYTWIQLLGAIYLIHLSISYFTKKNKALEKKGSTSFWKTVLLIEVLDTIFALDSIVAGLAFVNSSYSKIWIVYCGGMVGLIGMRFAADFFGSLMDRFPQLEASAYIMVGWVGVKLALSSIGWIIPAPVFWAFTLIVFLFGFLKQKR